MWRRLRSVARATAMSHGEAAMAAKNSQNTGINGHADEGPRAAERLFDANPIDDIVDPLDGERTGGEF
jgi:hypothetical protein